MDDPAATHPDEMLVTAPIGSCVVFNAHLWHGGTANNGGTVRRSLHSFFTRGDLRQQTHQQRYLRPSLYKRLSPAQRAILDVVDPETQPKL